LVEHLGVCGIVSKVCRATSLRSTKTFPEEIFMVRRFSLMLAVAATLAIPTVAMAAHAGGAHNGARGGGGHAMAGRGGHYGYAGGHRYGAYRGGYGGYGYGGPAYGYAPYGYGCVGLPVPVIGCL
jgi:uncharacterized membrane protein